MRRGRGLPARPGGPGADPRLAGHLKRPGPADPPRHPPHRPESSSADRGSSLARSAGDVPGPAPDPQRAPAGPAPTRFGERPLTISVSRNGSGLETLPGSAPLDRVL